MIPAGVGLGEPMGDIGSSCLCCGYELPKGPVAPLHSAPPCSVFWKGPFGSVSWWLLCWCRCGSAQWWALGAPVAKPHGEVGWGCQAAAPVTTIFPCRMAEPRFNNPYFWPPPPTMPSQVRPHSLPALGEEGKRMERGQL